MKLICLHCVFVHTLPFHGHRFRGARVPQCALCMRSIRIELIYSFLFFCCICLSRILYPMDSILDDGNIKEDFMVTPKMSSYLVAYQVSDLVNTNVTQKEQPKDLPVINIYTRKDVSDMTKYVTIRLIHN